MQATPQGSNRSDASFYVVNHVDHNALETG
jgi:hypothetical protein